MDLIAYVFSNVIVSVKAPMSATYNNVMAGCTATMSWLASASRYVAFNGGFEEVVRLLIGRASVFF